LTRARIWLPPPEGQVLQNVRGQHLGNRIGAAQGSTLSARLAMNADPKLHFGVAEEKSRAPDPCGPS
jgi:hypothetical protein